MVPMYKKGDKIGCSNCRTISLLPSTYKILSNIQLSMLPPYAREIIGDYQCGFRHNSSTILCIRQILEKEWDWNEAVNHLFIEFNKA
jgi:hypothetical protein